MRGTVQKLVQVGPPSEWSGAVAAAIGPEGRRELRTLWDSLSSAERREIKAKFRKGWVKKASGALPLLSKEKRRAHRRAHRFLKSDEKDWNAFLDNVERKSFVRAIKKDGRADEKLERHADQMNRLLTGKVLGTIHGRGTGTGSGVYKIIRLRGGGLGCTCPDWRYRQSVSPEGDQDCRHIRGWKFKKKMSKTASVDKTHRELDQLGVDWDDNKHFMEFCLRLTGKRHLDDMTAMERSKVVDFFKATEKVAESKQSLMSKLRRGDIILMTPEKSKATGARRAFEQSFGRVSSALQGPYTHAALYIGNNEIMEARAQTGGVKKLPVTAALRGKGFAVLRPRNMTPGQRAKAAKEARQSLEGKKYSANDLVGAGVDLISGSIGSKTVGTLMRKGTPRTRKGLQCGGLVAGAYLLAGHELRPGTHWQFVAPAALLKSPHMKVVGRAGAKKKLKLKYEPS